MLHISAILITSVVGLPVEAQEAGAPTRAELEAAFVGAAQPPFDLNTVYDKASAALEDNALARANAVTGAVAQLSPRNPGKTEAIRTIADSMLSCLSRVPSVLWKDALTKETKKLTDVQLQRATSLFSNPDYARLVALMKKVNSGQSIGAEREDLEPLLARLAGDGLTAVFGAMAAMPGMFDAEADRCYADMKAAMLKAGIDDRDLSPPPSQLKEHRAK